jgi:hypothetical protein
MGEMQNVTTGEPTRMEPTGTAQRSRKHVRTLSQTGCVSGDRSSGSGPRCLLQPTRYTLARDPS